MPAPASHLVPDQFPIGICLADLKTRGPSAVHLACCGIGPEGIRVVVVVVVVGHQRSRRERREPVGEGGGVFPSPLEEAAAAEGKAGL